MDKSKTKQRLLLDNEELRTRLEEAEGTLRAIRSGEVDALVVSGPEGDQLFTLQGADRSYRILFETMEEGAATLSDNGTILYCNRRLATMIGEPLEKVIGSSLDKYLSLKDWQIIQNTFKKGEEVTGREEIHIKTANGAFLPTLVSFSSIQVGDVRGICVTATDLTRQKRVEEALRTAHAELEERVKERTKELSKEIEDRKRVEEALRESEERWATTLASIGDAVIATDVEARVTFLNAVAEELTGWTLSEAVAEPVTTVFNIVNEQTRRKVENPVAKVLEQGNIVGLANHTLLVRKDGAEVPIDDSGAPIRDPNGKTMGVVLVFRDITERKKAEKTLQESEERYRSLFENMLDGFAYCRMLFEDDRPQDFIYLAVNGAFEKLTGLKDVVGKKVTEAIPGIKESNPELFEIYGRVALSGKPERFETYVEPLDEWFSISVYSPEKGCFVAVFEIITERKQAEEALRDHIRLLDDVIDGSTSPIFLKDNDGKFITINASLERMLGKSRQELKGKTDYDIAPKEVADYWRSHDTKVMATGKAIQIEEVADLQDGHHIFLANKFPLVNAHGQVYGVGAISHDITERKRMEEELRKSSDELDRRVQERTAEVCRQAELLDLAHDAIIVREIDGAITFWNEGATEMYGWTKEEALGKISCDLLETEFPMSQDEIMTKVVQEGRWEGELTHTRKDGKMINVLSRWALQKDEEGRPTGVMQINYDITQRLKLEEQLRQAQKMEAIGTLTGGIAHDFNNILATIVINSEMALLDLPGGSGVRTNLDLILKSGLRGRDLVKQMLLFSRKSGKKQEIITLTPLIKETFKLLRASLPTTIQMKLLLETESDAVFADPSQIQQVIMNLCTNAAYAMRGTTGSIDISLRGITFGSTDLPEAGMQPGDYLALSVKDTGSGMDEEVKKRIFEPFFTTKPVGEGTGLGLSVVYGIVKNHKGGITVYSEPGKGSIFKVYLPKVDTGVSVEAETPKPIPKGNERILVVDDEEVIVTALQNMLQHLGYQVTALMDSQEAFKLFSGKPSDFDLVIMDQTMPFMTGEDLGKELMRIRPDIPVILCTGYSDLISSEKAMAMGFRAFIMKPFTVREGAELVRRVLDQKEPSNSEKNP